MQTGPRQAKSSKARQRRRGPDIVGLVPRATAIFAWFSLGVAGVFYDRAHPRVYGLDGFFGVQRSRGVNAGYLDVAYAMVWVTMLLCALGLAVNSRRMRRTGDRYNRSLIFLGIGSAIALALDALLSL